MTRIGQGCLNSMRAFLTIMLRTIERKNVDTENRPHCVLQGSPIPEIKARHETLSLLDPNLVEVGRWSNKTN